MKRLILAGIVTVGALVAVQATTPAASAAGNCDGVRCMACPEGYVLSPTGNDCCRCVPIK
jgi:hypothetical protein